MIEFGSEQAIEANGRTYRLDKLRLKQIRRFREWVQERVGDPFATAERFVDRLPAAEAMSLVRRAEKVAEDLAAFSMVNETAQRHLLTEEGLTLVAAMLLERHHPGLDEDEVTGVAEVLAGRVLAILEKAMGRVPNGEGGAAAAPAESTGGESTRSSGTAVPA